MDKVELIQKIGNEICEGCNDDRDCGFEIDECNRIDNAINILDSYLELIKAGVVK